MDQHIHTYSCSEASVTDQRILGACVCLAYLLSKGKIRQKNKGEGKENGNKAGEEEERGWRGEVNIHTDVKRHKEIPRKGGERKDRRRRGRETQKSKDERCKELRE